MITVPMTVGVSNANIPVAITTDSPQIAMTLSAEYAVAQVDVYTDEYEFTPTAETQTINIANLMATDNITIHPIPSNYGLITWNGVNLTVS